MSTLAGRLRRSLGAKLLAAQVLVIVAGSLTLAVVALAVAPGLFHYHARMALGTIPPDIARHLDEGLVVAMLVALGSGTVVALVTAVAVSALLARRIVRPIGTLARAAERIAQGRYTARVPQGGSGDEVAVLGRLVDDLNAVSRAEERQLDLRLARWEPAKLVTAAVRAAAAAYQAKGVALVERVDPHLPRVLADPDRIGEVLANLLANALRHTPAGGRVEVAAARHGREVQLAVSDTGEGIAAELLERVFERLYRVDRARAHAEGGGSGIGLTITRAIVQAHGGRIWAESRGLGRGARFVVTLPPAADH